MLLETGCRPRIWEFLAREYERHVTSLISQRHFARERTLPCHATNIRSYQLVYECGRYVEILVANRFDHPVKLMFSFFARRSTDQTYDSRHALSVSREETLLGTLAVYISLLIPKTAHSPNLHGNTVRNPIHNFMV